MKRLITRTLTASGALTIGICLSATSFAAAASKTTTDTSSAVTQQHLQTIISKGDQEISRRLTSLGTLSGKISAAAKLSASDRATLTNEVSSETSGLTALKTKLDAETTLDGAKADAQSIYQDYRVYALVVPKVELLKVADDQQVNETKLSDLATKLQSRTATEQSSGKDVSSLQAALSDMSAKTQAAQAISSSIETKVIGLQPTDYNSDHAILSGDRDQLKTAHADNQAAFADAKTIIAALK